MEYWLWLLTVHAWGEVNTDRAWALYIVEHFVP